MGFSRFFRRRRWDAERVRELESYLETETADNIARGMSPEEARRIVLLAERADRGKPDEFHQLREEALAVGSGMGNGARNGHGSNAFGSVRGPLSALA